MPGFLLLPLAALWGFLWLLVTLLESASYIHDPARPLWQPVSIFASAVIVAACFIACWLRLGSFSRITVDRLAPWLIRSAVQAPLYMAGIAGLTYGLRIGIFSLGGSEYEPTAADSYWGYQLIKILVFYALWLGLAFGARMFTAWQERNGLLSRAESEIDGMRRALEPGLARLPVPVGDKTRLIETASIAWIEADDNYVRIHTDGQDYALRRTLQDLLTDLGEGSFARIHKSAAINLAEVQVLQPLGRGDAEVVLRNGARLRVSRRYKENLQRRMAH